MAPIDLNRPPVAAAGPGSRAFPPVPPKPPGSPPPGLPPGGAPPPAAPVEAQARPTAARPVRRKGGASRLYFFACLAFVLSLVLGSIINEGELGGRALYVTLLFAICAGPGFLGRFDPQHRLLSVFMGAYFVIFGMATYIGVITGDTLEAVWGGPAAVDLGRGNVITISDAVVILGALCFLGGYFLVHNTRGQRQSRFMAREWRYPTILKLGLALWLTGFIVMFAYDMTVSVYKAPPYILGIPVSIASNMRNLSPLGAVMLVYLVCRDYKPALLWTLLGLIIAAEFTFGFIVSSKEISFRILVLLFLGQYYLKGRLNLKLVAAMLAVSIPYLLFFNAYRMQMMEGGYLDPAAAFEAFEENLEAAKGKTKGETDVTGYSLRSLRGRVDGKVYIDIIVAGTNSGKAPYMYGETLTLFFQSFIPRLLWPEKPNISTGQLFNKIFHLSASPLTYVPTTQLGEWYWNFAMPGVIAGMFAMGLLFGRLSGALATGHMTIARFLVLLVATYYLAIRFEGNIAAQYSMVIRLVALVWLLDLLFRGAARSRPAASQPAPVTSPTAEAVK
jgi:hypothetical protein